MTLRKQQSEVNEIVTEIRGGADINKIFVDACPGAGKSLIPVIVGQLIPAGMADLVTWVVPRLSLQHQAEAGFVDPYFRKMLGHNLTIRSSTNESNPCRGLSGFTTTFQAIGTDTAGTVLNAVRSGRAITVLDEFHHLEDGGIWHKAIAPIVEASKYLILMTGTAARGDGKRIAYMPYQKTPGGLCAPDMRSHGRARAVHYSRADALMERAIIPLHFTLADGSVSWMESGMEIEHGSMAKIRKKDSGKAVYTALNTEYAIDLLDRATDHWMGVRSWNKNSKMLVVTAGIENAKSALEHLRRRGVHALLATSHDSPSAQRAIRQFKYSGVPVLVTIAMAYEGLDCRDITHIASLTHIRSTPWIIQEVSRAVRVQADIPYDYQMAYVFAPDDPLMRQIVEAIREEQGSLVKTPRRQAGLFESGKNTDPPLPGSNIYGIVPLGSDIAGAREVMLGGAGYRQGPPPPTPSDIEADLRIRIEKHIRRWAGENMMRERRINSRVKAHFGRPRSEMTIEELKKCLWHVEAEFPLGQLRLRPKFERAVPYHG